MISKRTTLALLAIAAGAGLATMWMPPVRMRPRRLGPDDDSRRVDESSEDSFPASDPPSFSPSSAVSGPSS